MLFYLTKNIHLHKKNRGKNSFIGYHYANGMQDLKYDGGIPMLEVSQPEQQVDNFANTQNNPYIILHLGTDLNANDYMSPINYRFHKVWSMERWAELVQKLKHKYKFVQVYANEHNPEIPDVTSIKVQNLNPVLQLLQHERCKMFLSVDNYLPHLAASIKKPGVVLWGSVSPYVWGWSWQYHKCPHLHLYNEVCDIQPCWRPSLWDTQSTGQQYVCDREYKCMKSIEVKQVIDTIEKVESKFVGTKKEDEIIL